MIVVALGANLASAAGAPEATIRAALDALGESGANPDSVSHFWRSPAWPDRRDPGFTNAAASVVTALSPEALLKLLHGIETRFGRIRSADAKRNAPRTLDLDLIDYNGLVQAGPPELPHPRMAERAFVLLPLREIARNWRHPVGGQSVDELIAALPGEDVAQVVRGDAINAGR
jgi:2-amino-4-hydroxy-6-hydroxymethyldihydropteridine diphosphokinase